MDNLPDFSMMVFIVGIAHHRAPTAERDARSRLTSSGARMAPSFHLPIYIPLTLIFASLIAAFAISTLLYRVFVSGPPA